MRRTLYKSLSSAYKNHPRCFGELRRSWMMRGAHPPAMCVLSVEQITWQEAMTEAFEMAEGTRGALKNVSTRCENNLDDLASIVRQQLGPLERRTAEALLVIGVHERDTTEALREADATHVGDFEWQRQLRYNWEADQENCIIRQARAMYRFGYEYVIATRDRLETLRRAHCYPGQ